MTLLKKHRFGYRTAIFQQTNSVQNLLIHNYQLDQV